MFFPGFLEKLLEQLYLKTTEETTASGKANIGFRSHRRCYVKKGVLKKNSQSSQENRSATLLKGDSNIVVFL